MRSLVMFGAACLAACGPSMAEVGGGEFEGLGISEQDARVTSQQAAQAKVIVDSTKAYLPFAYTPDGCYARALYMSMELAARRIPTSAQYLSGYLQPSPSVAWGWHVAPMVQIDGATERTILDPSLAPTGPVSLTEWVRRSNPIGSYTLQWTLGSVYFTDSYAHRNSEVAPVIESFAQLTPFKAADIAEACATMREYLTYETNTSITTRQQLLLGRTRTLANRLSEVGKLSGYAPGQAISCGNTWVPLCRETGAACSTAADCCSRSCSGTCVARPADAWFADAGVPAVDAGVPAVDAGVPAVDAGFPALENGITVASLSGAASSARTYVFEVPSGTTSLRFELRGGSGDADLYLRHGARPTSTTYDYRPYLSDANETVTPTAVKAGTWFVMVRGYTSYSGVSLTARRSP